MPEIPRTNGLTRPRPLRTRFLRTRGRRLALAALVAALPVAALLAAPFANAAVPPPAAGWTTVFSDDFTGAAGTAPSSANWIYDLGTSYPGGAGNWGTGEVETVTNSTNNVYQDGAGHLQIKPIKDAAGNWTSGRIETARTDFAAPVGGQLQISASIMQPNPAGGLGYWPAFWAMGAAARPVGATNWPSIGELDIMEDVNALSSVSHTFHCGVDPGGPCNETTGISSGLIGCGNCQTAYHTYSVVVDRSHAGAEQLRFATDGVVQLTVNQNQVDANTWATAVDHGFFAILNVAIGGAYPNPICGCTTPQASTTSGSPMSVDWVSIQTTTGGSTSAPPTTTPPTTTPPTTTSASPSHSASATPSPSGTTTPPGGGTGAGSTIQAEAYSAQNSTTVEATTDTGGGQDVTSIHNGSWLQYNAVNFGSAAVNQFQARVASGATGGASGLVEVHLDSLSNPSIGSFAVGNTGGWQSWTSVPANIAPTTGVHTVYLVFTSGQPANYVNVNWFTFPGGPTGSSPTPTPSATPSPTGTGGSGATSTIQAEAYSGQSGSTTETTTDTGGGQDVTSLSNGDWLQYNAVNFGSSGLGQFKARVASGATGGASGLVEVHLDSRTGPSIGSFAVGNTGGWQSWTTVPANITRTTGVHTLYLVFTSGQPAAYVSLNWFTFAS